MKLVKYFSVSMVALLVIVAGLKPIAALAKDDKTANLKMKVEVHCSDGKARLIEGLKKVDGVKTVNVDVPKKTVDINYDPTKTDKDKLVKAVEQLGFYTEFTPKDAKVPNKCTNEDAKKDPNHECPGKK